MIPALTLALAGDAPRLATLQNAAFPDAWSVAFFVELLGQEGVFALCAGMDGFILVRAVAGEAEILTFAVAPAARRGGLGRALLAAAMARAAQTGAQQMFLEVGITNIPAISLYSCMGFREVGRRPAYYQHGTNIAEDALVLQVQLPLPEQNVAGTLPPVSL